tara:strand:- start:9340 stop:10269 length:930 start_codon:yes stop_codon:yes gene_type:complete
MKNLNDLSESFKRELVKLYSLPFPMVEYNFNYYTEFLNKQYKTKEKFNSVFSFMASNNMNENELLETVKDVKHMMVDTIKALPEYQELVNFDTSDFKVTFNGSKQNVYKMNNAGKQYLSIDLVKANFQAMRFVNPKLVLDTDSFEDFCNKLPVPDFMLRMKKLRQYVFGNLEPKKQQKLQKYFMSRLSEFLLENNFFSEENMEGLNSDELVICIDNYPDLDLKNLKDKLSQDDFLKQFDFHFEEFTLNLVHENHKFFKKDKKDGSFSLKNVPAGNTCEVLKYLYNEPVFEEDLMFFQDGRLAKYQKSLF